MEYHDIFSLDDNELGCASQVKHSIKVTNDEPFKERFQRIPPTLLEEVRMHVNDMLQAGAIRPSSSPWCNAVVLVRKKDGGLCFCIDFRKLNVRTKKDSYPVSLASRKHWRVWRGLAYSLVSTLSLAFGRWKWMRHPNSIPPLLWGHWASLSVNACRSDCVMRP